MTQGRIRVLLMDDDELARQRLRCILELEEDMEVVGEASSVEEALEMVTALSPNIVVMWTLRCLYQRPGGPSPA